MLIALLTTLVVSATPGPPSGYALVVTNNRSLEATRADLHYADDDGAKYAQLFSEALGRDRVTLLTQFDPESQQLFPDWAKAVEAPSRVNLLRSVASLARRLDEDNAAGKTTEVYFVFAGHGDVEHGQGYVDLSDSKLTARDLEELVVKPLHATHLHLILDSCNSYFMLASRKPGGQRFEVSDAPTESLLTRYPNVGALLSTSAEAVTYEWSEVQSGIFSYELRSGLRGAADVNGDGQVSYAEIAAFISNANRLIPNDLYRPKVFMGAPGRQLGMAVWTVPAEGHVLRVPAAGARRFTLRDPRGVRLLDVNKEDQTPLRLALPPHTSLNVEETLAAQTMGGRPTLHQRVLAEDEQTLGELPTSGPAVAARGEAPIFASLFQAPFGRRAFLAQQQELSHLSTPPLGISVRDVERLRLHLEAASDGARQLQVERAYLFVFDGVLTAASGFASFGVSTATPSERNFALGVAEAAALLVATVPTYYVLRAETREHQLFVDFDAKKVSSEAERAQVVTAFEGYLRDLAASEAGQRKTTGLVELLAAGIAGVSGGYLLASKSASSLDFSTFAIGAYVLADGIWNLTLRRGAAENEWKAYQAEPEVRSALGLQPPPVQLSLAPVLLSGGAGVRLSLRF